MKTSFILSITSKTCIQQCNTYIKKPNKMLNTRTNTKRQITMLSSPSNESCRGNRLPCIKRWWEAPTDNECFKHFPVNLIGISWHNIGNKTVICFNNDERTLSCGLMFYDPIYRLEKKTKKQLLTQNMHKNCSNKWIDR